MRVYKVNKNENVVVHYLKEFCLSHNLISRGSKMTGHAENVSFAIFYLCTEFPGFIMTAEPFFKSH